MPTLELVIAGPARKNEVLMALLLDLGAEAFEERPDALAAFGPVDGWNPLAREKLHRWMDEQCLQGTLRVRILDDENWNARWEQSIEPIAVGPFLIKPSWREAPADHDARYVLEIDPKMSFGTGYHATTRLVLNMLPELVQEGARVLDAGTGTGILALAAVRCGAGQAVAFDTDVWAITNATENIARNDASGQVTVVHGDLSAVPEEPFDLVLANINRNVILSDLEGYVRRLREGGMVALSGLLLEDRSMIREAARDVGLTEIKNSSEGDWWTGVWVR